MNTYNWGYIETVTKAKLDLDISEDSVNDSFITTLTSRFPYYANEAMTQICSAIKPKATFAYFEITTETANTIVTMPQDFIGFGDDQNYQIKYNHCEKKTYREEIHDIDFKYCGYNQLMFNKPGKYYISYKARWYFFDSTITKETDLSSIPADIIDCIPSYIASQCYKVDDEVKAQIFRNEFEMAIARIDDTRYENVKTFTIGGDW